MLVAAVGLASPLAVQAKKKPAAHAKKKPKRKVPVGFFGTVLEPGTVNPAITSDQALNSTTALMARSGVESERVSFAWEDLEPSPNTYDFTLTDRIVRDAALHGIRVLANLEFRRPTGRRRTQAYSGIAMPLRTLKPGPGS